MSGNGGTTTKKKPFDLDAAAAARREAEGEGFTFVFKGATFTCLPSKEWPISVSGRLTSGDLIGALSAILGPDQAEVFLAGEPTMGDVETLMTEIASNSGVETLGE
jgi:hypothetical protein